MFADCIGLTDIDVSNFNTANTWDVNSMFTGCTGMRSVDLSNFNTARFESLGSMFYGCSNLVTIYVGDEWQLELGNLESTDMFHGCTSLVGGKGTTYDPDHTNAEYAHIDGGTANPGYFTDKSLLSRGDVDDNGRVNIADVTAMIDYIPSGGAQSVSAANADVDGNGIVNIADVTALIDYILSGHWSV